jgi:hypothetical protein
MPGPEGHGRIWLSQEFAMPSSGPGGKLWAMPERTLRGRDAERELLTAVVHATVGGSGGVVLIDGMAGIRQSVLLEDMARAARASGCNLASGAIEVRTGAARLRRSASPTDVAALAPHLGSLSEGARGLVDVGAVLGQRFPLAVAADMLGRPAGALVQAVAECRAAHVLEDAGDVLAFRHDLIRQAAYGSLPEPVRVALHRDAARLLAGHGASTLEVAPHLARSARTGDLAAVDGLRDAASELIATNPGAAADLSLRAWELLPPDDHRRAEAGAHAVDMMGWAGRLSEAEAVRDQMQSRGSSARSWKRPSKSASAAHGDSGRRGHTRGLCRTGCSQTAAFRRRSGSSFSPSMTWTPWPTTCPPGSRLGQRGWRARAEPRRFSSRRRPRPVRPRPSRRSHGGVPGR